MHGVAARLLRGSRAMGRGKQTWKRVRRRVEVRYGSDQVRHIGYSRNVSRTGLMVGAARVFAPGTILNLELAFPGATFRLRGEVVWARAGSATWVARGRVGMGITFIDPPEDLLHAIKGLSSVA